MVKSEELKLEIKMKNNDNMTRPNSYPTIHKNECKACGRCVLACPFNLLELSEDLNKNGYQYVEYKGEGCTGCANCYYTCPEHGPAA